MKETLNTNSKNYIVESLFVLLKGKTIENIQVTEICKKAGVGRSTFYKHFNNKNDIINYYLMTLYQKYTETNIKQPTSKEDFEYNMITLLTLIYKNKDELLLLLKNNLGQKMYEFLTDKLILISNLRETKDYFYPYIIVGAIYSTIHAWSKNNFKNDINEVSASIVKIITLEWMEETNQ